MTGRRFAVALPGAGPSLSKNPALQKEKIMRAETTNIIDEIKQSIALLRRHL